MLNKLLFARWRYKATNPERYDIPMKWSPLQMETVSLVYHNVQASLYDA